VARGGVVEQDEAGATGEAGHHAALHRRHRRGVDVDVGDGGAGGAAGARRDGELVVAHELDLGRAAGDEVDAAEQARARAAVDLGQIQIGAGAVGRQVVGEGEPSIGAGGEAGRGVGGEAGGVRAGGGG